jgi:hypothetical protein
MNDLPRRKRRSYQFSLRALLAFVLLVSIGMSWLAARMEKSRRQREAVKAIEKMGGSVVCEKPRLGEPLVDDFLLFLKVDGVHFSDTEVIDAGLEHLEGLSNLVLLDLSGTQVRVSGRGRLPMAWPLRGLLLWADGLMSRPTRASG